MALIPRHLGNSTQPQKFFPEFAPFLATRLTIALPHWGQLGSAVVVEGVDSGTFFLARSTLFEVSPCVFSIIAVSLDPSISSIFCPLAKDCASEVKIPEVTTNPPAAPFVTITPSSSRTTVTDTL